MSLDPDNQYIEETLKGNTKAFGLLVDRYKHMVYTLAFRIVKNKEDAEEAAQDTFVKVYNRLSQFKGDSKFSTWVYKIAYHGSLDVLKKRKRNVETLEIGTFKEKGSGVSAYGGQDIDALERQRVIKHAIEKLPPEDSSMITLFYYEELSLEEISKIMDISVNTLKVRLFRSRKRLAELLKGILELEKM